MLIKIEKIKIYIFLTLYLDKKYDITAHVLTLLVFNQNFIKFLYVTGNM